MKLRKFCAASTMAAAMVISMGVMGAGTAFAANSNTSVSSETSWTVPTTPMTNTVTKDGKLYKVITSFAGGWAAVNPDYVGVSNSTWLAVQGGGITTPTDLTQAKTSTMIGVWASEANEMPNAYNWNTFYNLYANSAENTTGAKPETDLTMTNANWDTETGTLSAFRYRPELLYGNNSLSTTAISSSVANIQAGKFYSDGSYDRSGNFTGTEAENSSQYVLPGDDTYDPEIVGVDQASPFGYVDTYYDFADAVEKIEEKTKNYNSDGAVTESNVTWKTMNLLPRTTRYEESAEECALTAEKLMRGSVYYTLSKIADGTVSKKKVAFISGSVDTTGSTATVAAVDCEDSIGMGSSNGHVSVSGLVVDQLTTSTVKSERTGWDGTGMYSDSGRSYDTTYKTYTATADELLSCDIIYGCDTSMTTEQLRSWVKENATGTTNKAKADTVQIFTQTPSQMQMSNFTAEKLMYGIYNICAFYPEIWPDMELMAYYYDNMFHLKTEWVGTALNWACANADLPEGCEIGKLADSYSVNSVDAKFAAGYKYYESAQSSDPVISRILANKDLDGNTSDKSETTNADGSTTTVTMTYDYAEHFKPSSTYAAWAKSYSVAKKSQNIKVSPKKKTYTASKLKKSAKSFKITVKGAKTSVSYKSSSKKVTVSKKGKVTVKKGTKKGTYTITVTTKANSSYKKDTAKVKVVVK